MNGHEKDDNHGLSSGKVNMRSVLNTSGCLITVILDMIPDAHELKSLHASKIMKCLSGFSRCNSLMRSSQKYLT